MDHPGVVQGRLSALPGVLRLRRGAVRAGSRRVQSSSPAKSSRRSASAGGTRPACSGCAGSSPTPTRSGPTTTGCGPSWSEARLEQIQDMITDLASNERYEDVLQGFVGSSVADSGRGRWRAAGPGAPGRIDPARCTSRGSPRRRRSRSPTTSWPGGPGPTRSSPSTWPRPVVTTASWPSTRAAACSPRCRESTLETYARLAAAALDTADALDEARHQANTAQALLDLATSLTEIVSTEEMAAKVAAGGTRHHRL